MMPKPLPIKDVAELVAQDLIEGGFSKAEARSIQKAKSFSELRGRLASFGFGDHEAHEFILSAVIDDTRCFVCGRAEVQHADTDYNAEGMCTRSIIEETK